ncbi:MAG: glycoside hydrolase family protein, partial [Planctomycetota bacterium]
MNKLGAISLLLTCLSTALADVPVTAEVFGVSKIWDKAPHNAFTDLIRRDGCFYCVFREGRGHACTDGKIRVLESDSSDVWTSAALIALEGHDLRDPHVSITPDNRLMLIGGVAARKKDNQSTPTGTFVSFSEDGRKWTKPLIVTKPGRWLWRVSWHEGKAYGVTYGRGQDGPYIDLRTSSDGRSFATHLAELFAQGRPTEVTLRFGSDSTCYALVRRDRLQNEPSSAVLGVSTPDYAEWRWHDLGERFNGFGGPNFIEIPSGHWVAAGRMFDGGVHTALTYLDVDTGTMSKLTKLPSGGDTSYPGLAWHEDTLYVSYYSGHEG